MAPTDLTETPDEDTDAGNGARRRRRVPGAGAKPLVIVESPAKAKTIAGLLGSDYVVESSIGHIRDLPRRADEVPAAYKGEAWSRLGVDVDNGFKPLYVVSAGEEVPGGQVEAAGQAGQRGLPGLGRGPRGRVDRLAPPRGAGAPGAGQADGLPRDHPPGHRAGRQRVAGPRPAAGRRPGGPPDPRPALRLRGVAGPVEEDHAPAVRRPGPERGHPDGGRAGAGPHGVPLGRMVGHRRHLHRAEGGRRPPRATPRLVHRLPGGRRRRGAGLGPRLRRHRRP